MNPAHNPVVRIVTQRDESDCGICVLAMFLDKSYEDVLSVAVKTTNSKRLHRSGMYSRQILDTAAALGVRLRQKRKFDFAAECGVLVVEFKKSSHVAFLKKGLIFDTDGYVWDPDAYFMAFEGTPKALYVVDEREDR